MPAGIGVGDEGGRIAKDDGCSVGGSFEVDNEEAGGCGIGRILSERDGHEKREVDDIWPGSPRWTSKRPSGIRMRHKHLRARQDGEKQSPQPSLAPILDTTTSGTDPTTGVAGTPVREANLNVGVPEGSSGPETPVDSPPSVPFSSTEQAVLSPTPPPSPASTDPSPVIGSPAAVPPPVNSSAARQIPAASPDIPPSAVSSLAVSTPSPTSAPPLPLSPPNTTPVVTITSYLSVVRTETVITTTTKTKWRYSTVTVPGTVVVYATPVSDSTGTEAESEESMTGTSSTVTATRTSASPTNSIVVLPGNGGYNGGGGGSYELPDSPTSSSNASREGSTSLTPKLVGGIIGGLAGAALFLWVILLLIRRHKQNVLVNQRVEAGYGGPPPVAMTERSSITPISGAGFWSLGRSSRQSQTSEPVSEERGFYKVSGRKLPPVIGGPRPDLSAQTSSFFQDEENRWLGGPRTPVASPISPTSPASLTSSGPSRYSGATQATASPTTGAFGHAGAPVGLSFAPQAGPSSYPHAGPSSAPHSYPHAVAHPSSTPARIPEENGEEQYQAEIDRDRSNTPRLSVQRSRDLAGTPVSQLRDGLGRSLPSLDGSRTSRFTEDIV